MKVQGLWYIPALPSVGETIIFRQFVICALLVLPVAFHSAHLTALETPDMAQDLLDQMSGPLFDAAGIDQELRFTIVVVDDDQPVARMVGDDKGEVSLGVFRLADTPEEVAAAVARVIGEKETRLPQLSGSKGYKFRARLPSRSRLRGAVTSVDEAIAQPGITAAEETLDRRGGYGPALEQIRVHARNLDSFAIGLLRKADIGGDALLHLYEAMAANGAGLFERGDFEGRKILHEQIAWLRDRIEENDGRTPYWRSLDDEFSSLKTSLER